MANGTQTIDYGALAQQAGAISSQPPPQSGNVDYAALAKQAGAVSSQTAAQPQPDSMWRKVYDAAPVANLGKLAGQLSDWANQKADAAHTQDLNQAAQGKGSPVFLNPSMGYDLLARTSGLVRSFLNPVNLAITGGVIAANTNPFTGIPADALIVAHGGYGMVKNASAALQGDPNAAERFFLSGSEATGGAAGVAGQVGALRGPVRAPVATTAEETATPGTPQQAAATGAAPADEGPGAPTQPRTAAPAAQAPGGGRIAQTLSIMDPPPNQLLTKAIKPMASNTGWDAAIAKAAPDMKAVEADLGHPITGVDDALNAVSIAKKGIWKQYEAKLGAASTGFGDEETGATIDGNEIADAMMGAIDKRTALQNPDLVERIQKVADTYRRPMGVDEAEDFLQSANNDLHSYYAKNKVGQQVAARDPSMGYVVAEGNQLRDSLYSTLDDLTGPGAADLKGRYGALSNVENELLRRKNVSARQQPDSLAEQLSMARAYGKIAVGVARMSPSSLLEGTQSLAAAKWLKTRGTTDAMIGRAFQALGTQNTPATAAPTGAGPTMPAAAGAAAGYATPDETQGSNPGPIATLLNRYDPVQARQAFANPVTQDALNTLNPDVANSLIKKFGVADTRKYFRGRG